MSKTVNILGDTPKKQWLSAIKIFETCIVSNLDAAFVEIGKMEYNLKEELPMHHNVDTARKETINFANEMRRLVENIPD